MILFATGAAILKGLGMAFLLIGAFAHVGTQSKDGKTGKNYSCLAAMFAISGFVNPTLKGSAGF